MKGLKIYHYDCVEDIIEEALSTMCGVNIYNYDSLEKDIEYVCGSIAIVKLGDKPNTLKHKHDKNEWSEDVEVSESYEYATYYRCSELDKIVENNLSRKFYNNDFL